MIKLEYFDKADFDQLIQWSGDEAFLLQWAGPQFTYPLTHNQLEDYIIGANEALSNKLIYKAIDTQSSKVVGHVSLGGIDRNNRSGRIGKVLVGASEERGKGVGQGIMLAILSVAFDELKLHRVSLGVFDFNEEAIQCYKKVGFQQEGLLRHARRFRNTYWNLIEMSILEEEWKKL